MEENNKISQNEVIDSNNEKSVNSTAHTSTNDELKKQDSSNDKKSIWDDLFIVALSPFLFIIPVGINGFFNGTGFMGSHESGLESAVDAIALLVVGFWFIYIPATILIAISVIKKIKDKIHNWIWSD